MKGSNSIGDLSRFAQLRQSNALLKARLAQLSKEAASGLKSDVPAALGGNMGRLAHVQSRLALLESYDRNASLLQSEQDGLQVALSAVGDIVSARGAQMLTAPTMSGSAVDALCGQAMQDFGTVVRMLNTQIGGRFVLSGTAVTTAPLSQPDDILDLARAQVSGLSDPAGISAAIDAWFASDAPTGFAAQAFHGTSLPTSAGVSPDTTITQDVNALDPAFRTTLKGLVLGALAGDPGLGLSSASKAALLGQAGQRLVQGSTLITQLQAELGMKQEIVQQAVSRNTAETSALSIARSDMLSADPYETASALAQTQTSLQNLYALTARLSQLSLTDYIK